MVAEQSLNGIQVLNVFTYQLTSAGPGSLGSFHTALNTLLFNAIKGIQSAHLAWVVAKYKNQGNVAEVYESAVSGNGARAGDATTTCPPWVTYTYLLRRSTSVTRNGRKAYAGVLESDLSVSGTNPPGAGNAALLSAQSGIVTDADGNTWRPVISGLDGLLIVSNPISSSSFQRISTQNTRKTGRGK